MSKHTQEPWATSSGRIYPAGEARSTVASVARDIKDWTLFNEEDARRIVACVNACRGLPTDELEQKGLVAAVGTQLLDADQQRDELLTALEEIAGCDPYHQSSAGTIARAAIAKAKGGAS